MKRHSIQEAESRCAGLEVRPITREYIEKYCGQKNIRNTVRGYAFFLNDEYIGSGGVEYRPDSFFVFSDIAEGANINKMTVWRCSKIIIEMIKNMNVTTVATSDKDNHKAQAFVKSCGYIPYADDEEYVYFFKEAQQ